VLQTRSDQSLFLQKKQKYKKKTLLHYSTSQLTRKRSGCTSFKTTYIVPVNYHTRKTKTRTANLSQKYTTAFDHLFIHPKTPSLLKSMEFVKVIAPLVSLILNPLEAVTKHVVYPFKVSKNVSSLESATKKLRALKEDVETDIAKAEHKNGMATKEAELWLDQVEVIEQKAKEIDENYQQLHRCIFNISPNLWSNYKISRNAAKKYIQVKNLCDEKAKIQLIVDKPPPLTQEMPASSSRSHYLQSALDYIKDDVHSTIGIWGTGGIGKTHLLKQINNDPSINDAFDVVIFVTCSQECSEEKVQNAIINKLHLNKNDENQRTIYNFLRQRSFVLLLDDLWSRVDLDKVGIPNLISMVGNYKGKTVITTRSIEVCGEMEVGESLIQVHGLNEEDAWSLFMEKVTEETIMSHPHIKKYALDVIKKLGGLPLALITVGRAMYSKRDPCIWENTLMRLQQAQPNNDESSSSIESVYHTLSLSYENLNSTEKDCFLLCSLWPDDHSIKRNELVELWMGHGLINNFDIRELIFKPDIQSAYNVGYTLIRKLQDVCLLDEGEDDDFSHEVSVKMHDVIRDMALWIANNKGSRMNKWIVPICTNYVSKDINVPPNTEKLSLMNFNQKEISFSCTSYSPKLSTLLITSTTIYSRVLTINIQHLELFLGLIFLDLSNHRLEDFPIGICKLVNLQFLNLSYCGIDSLPEELVTLINLRYLLIRENSICTISDGILSKLKALRVLDISNGFYTVNFEKHVVPSLLEELKLLVDFQALGITINDMNQFDMLNTFSVPARWLHVCFDSTLSSFTFSLSSQMQTNLFSLFIEVRGDIQYVVFDSANGSSCNLGRLEKLTFSNVSGAVKDIIWNNLNTINVLSRLQYLEFLRCHSLESISSWVVYLPCLRELRVIDCVNLKQLINEEHVVKDGEIEASYPTFPCLRKLYFFGLQNMESICSLKITFPSLEVLQFYNCRKLKKLPFMVDNIPPKLRLIRGLSERWDNMEWEDDSLKSTLQHFVTIEGGDLIVSKSHDIES
jgi:disease resistance protein RPS2